MNFKTISGPILPRKKVIQTCSVSRVSNAILLSLYFSVTHDQFERDTVKGRIENVARF